MPDCLICHDAMHVTLTSFSSMGTSKSVCVLRCGHCFHKECLETWFNEGRSKKTCPLCKVVVGPTDVREIRRPEPLTTADAAAIAALLRAASLPDPTLLMKELEEARQESERKKAEIKRVDDICVRTREERARLETELERVSKKREEKLHAENIAYAECKRLGVDLDAAAAVSVGEVPNDVLQKTVQKQTENLEWRQKELRSLDLKMDHLRRRLVENMAAERQLSEHA